MQTRIALLALLGGVANYFDQRHTASVTWGPTVITNSGGIRGIVSLSRDGWEYYSWLKIPYAQPPLGSLRFASPVPVKKWKGVRDGHEHGSVCSQFFKFNFLAKGTEDCLFLNVHAHKLTSRDLLPVIVLIHGGAFIFGSGDSMSPSYFMDEKVIVVTLNYRLNVMGFLTTGDSIIRGNMGLKDQVLALKWIKENIHHFGGDPNKISILGHSAGGASVHYLTLSARTKGLFRKAISMAGTSIMPWAFSTTFDAVQKSKDFARHLNCPTSNSTKMVQCLRALDNSELMEAYKKNAHTITLMFPSKEGLLFGPTVESVDDDEAFLTRYPYDVMVEGQAHKIPWLAGVCRDEGLLSTFEFYRDQKALDLVENNWDRAMENSFHFSPTFSPPEAAEARQKLREFYFSTKKTFSADAADGPNDKKIGRDAQISRYTKLFSDGHFLVGTSLAASIQKQFSPVHLYFYKKTGGSLEFSNFLAGIQDRYHPLIETSILTAKLLRDKYIAGIPLKDYGISHGDDVAMISSHYSLMNIRKNNPNYKFSKAMVRLFVDFARNDGDEDETKLKFLGVKFTPNQGNEGPLMYLEVDEDPKMISEPFADRTDFWRSIINYPKLFSSNIIK